MIAVIANTDGSTISGGFQCAIVRIIAGNGICGSQRKKHIMKRPKINQYTRKAVYELCNGHCAYCGCKITEKQMQVDHIIPFEFSDVCIHESYNPNSIANYLPACRSCNNYKHTLSIAKFRKSVSRWHEVLLRDSVTYRNAVRFGQVEPRPHEQVFYFEKLGVHPEALDWFDGMFYKGEQSK